MSAARSRRPFRFTLPAMVAAVLLSACSTTPETTEHPEWQRFFDADSVRGAVIITETADGGSHVCNPECVDRPLLPASTFKILNALIAIETGVVTDADDTFAWDGVDRGWERWNRDLDLRSAFRYSAVWVFQEIARRIGEERMGEWVKRAGYGNGDIGGGIDRFWLEGALRITPREQVGFLIRLHRGDLPFSSHTMAIVKSLMLMEEGDGYRLRGKTGWATASDPQPGWLVGWVERGETAAIFATVIDMARMAQAPLRERISRAVLTDMGWLPAAR